MFHLRHFPIHVVSSESVEGSLEATLASRKHSSQQSLRSFVFILVILIALSVVFSESIEILSEIVALVLLQVVE